MVCKNRSINDLLCREGKKRGFGFFFSVIWEKFLTQCQRGGERKREKERDGWMNVSSPRWHKERSSYGGRGSELRGVYTRVSHDIFGVCMSLSLPLFLFRERNRNRIQIRSFVVNFFDSLKECVSNGEMGGTREVTGPWLGVAETRAATHSVNENWCVHNINGDSRHAHREEIRR